MFAIVAHQASPSQSGAYGLAMNYLTLFVLISSLGLNDPTTRDVARNPDQAIVYLGNFGLLRLVSGGVCYGLVALLVIGIFDYSASTTRFIILMGLCIIPEGLNQLFQALFTAFERQAYNATVITVINVTNVGLAWWVLHSQADILMLAWARLACASLGLLFNLGLMSRRTVARWIRPSLAWTWKHFRLYLPFTLMVAFYAIEWRTDILILSAYRAESEIASYYTVQSLLMASLMPLEAYRFAVLPPMTRLVQERSERLDRMHERSFWYMSIIVVPLTITIAILASDILSLFNPAFAGASDILAVLMIVLIVSFLNEPNGLLMIAAGQQQTLAILLGASVAANIIANLILAPALGGMGAALARVISVIVFSVPNAVLVSRRIRRHHPLQKLPRILPAAGLAAVALVVFKSFLPWWLAGFMSMCVYAPALIAFQGVPSSDLNALRQYGAAQVQQKSKTFKNAVRRFQ